jgi:L-iditol 2-dehydrogenase
MKALQVTQPNSFSVVQVPTPNLDNNGPGHILVRTGWVSLCGSDIPFFTGGKPFLPYPLQWGVPIHECMGQVVQSTSMSFQPGNWVVAIPEGDRGLAEYFAARDDKTVLLDKDLEDNPASCLIQPLSTVMNAVDRLGDFNCATVAVIGLGSIGLLFCWLLKKGGAGQILGLDPLSSRCELAEAIGADQTYPLQSGEFLKDSLDPIQLPEVDICIEAVGHQMQTINDALQITRKKGTVMAFGVPDHSDYSLDYEVFFRKNLQLVASVTPDWQIYLDRARLLFQQNQAELGSLITHKYKIQEAEKAFLTYSEHADGIIKALIDTSQW